MKLPVPFVQLPLSFDADVLAAEIIAIGESHWLPHPQGFAGNSMLPLIAVNGDPGNESFSGPMQPTPYLDRCPYLMQVMDAIGVTLGRTRLMRLSGHSEVTSHADQGYYWRERVRVHVPIITQPTVRFYCGDQMVNMAAGECWIFDTWRQHRVLNDNEHSRVHLVIDTVGGERFWGHIARGQAPGQPQPDWRPRRVSPDPAARPALDFESVNVPVVMTPWELREHIGFLLTEPVQPPPSPALQQSLLTFTRRWHALWSCHGERREGWPRYRAVLDESRAQAVACGAGEIRFRNMLPFLGALDACVFDAALADRGGPSEY
jgi:hypothetical protein